MQFHWSKPRRSSFLQNSLDRAKFTKANLRYAKAVRTNFLVTNFSDADLWKAQILNSFLDFANVSWANLKGTAIWACCMRGATLDHADLRRAEFIHSYLEWSSLQAVEVK